MGRPKLNPVDRRTIHVAVRLTKMEAEKLDHYRKRCNPKLSRSSYLQRLLSHV